MKFSLKDLSTEVEEVSDLINEAKAENKKLVRRIIRFSFIRKYLKKNGYNVKRIMADSCIGNKRVTINHEISWQ